MPQIRPYQQQLAPEGGIPAQQAQPSDFGGPGVFGLGKAIQSVGQDAAYVEHFINQAAQQQDVANAQVKASELHTDLTLEMYKQAEEWDPKNGPFGEKFRALVQKRIDEQRDTFPTSAGQQHYETRAATIASQLVIESARIESQLHGQAVKEQLRASVDKDANLLQQHPAYTTMKLDDVAMTADIYAKTYGLRGPHAERLKRDAQEGIAISGVQGLINTVPNRALELLQSKDLANDPQYGWIAKYIPREKFDALTTSAQTAVNAQAIEARRVEADAKRQTKEMQETNASQLTGKFLLHEGNPGNPNYPPLTATEVGRMAVNQQIDDNTARALGALIDSHSQARTLKNDEQASSELLERMSLEWGNPNKLLDRNEIIRAATGKTLPNGQYVPAKLTLTRMQSLLKQFDDAQTEDGQKLAGARNIFLSSHKSSITQANPLLGKLDPDGDVRFGNLTQHAIDEEARLRKENKSPHLLYTKSSPEYLGNRLEGFQKTMQESMGSISQNLKRQPSQATPEKRRLPNETGEQYWERMNKK